MDGHAFPALQCSLFTAQRWLGVDQLADQLVDQFDELIDYWSRGDLYNKQVVAIG